MKSEQIEVITEALNDIDRFLKHEIIQIISATSELEPQRDFAAFVAHIERLRSFGFHYSEGQLALLEQLIDHLQTTMNGFIDALRNAVQLRAAQPGTDEATILEQVQQRLNEVRVLYSTDARRFKQALTSGHELSTSPAMKRSIFICYRRADSHWVVDRIYRQLRKEFENVFRDLDSIPLGVPFPEVILDTLRTVNAVLVVIGPAWLEQSTRGQAKVFDNKDHVRIEIETALKSGAQVVPVLITPARMPLAAELPKAIKKLAIMNGIQLRPDPDFDNDLKRLMQRLAP